MHSVNKGIVQSGGHMTVGQMATGDNASIYGNTIGKNEGFERLQAQLQEVMDLIKEQGHGLPNQSEVLQSAEAARDELSKERPNKLTLKSILSGIAESVQSIGTIATAVEGVKTAVGAILG